MQIPDFKNQTVEQLKDSLYYRKHQCELNDYSNDLSNAIANGHARTSFQILSLQNFMVIFFLELSIPLEEENLLLGI